MDPPIPGSMASHWLTAQASWPCTGSPFCHHPPTSLQNPSWKSIWKPLLWASSGLWGGLPRQTTATKKQTGVWSYWEPTGNPGYLARIQTDKNGRHFTQEEGTFLLSSSQGSEPLSPKSLPWTFLWWHLVRSGNTSIHSYKRIKEEGVCSHHFCQFLTQVWCRQFLGVESWLFFPSQ